MIDPNHLSIVLLLFTLAVLRTALLGACINPLVGRAAAGSLGVPWLRRRLRRKCSKCRRIRCQRQVWLLVSFETSSRARQVALDGTTTRIYQFGLGYMFLCRRIGFQDLGQEGGFVWVDGSSVHFVDWAPGEPNGVNAQGTSCVSSMASPDWRNDNFQHQTQLPITTN